MGKPFYGQRNNKEKRVSWMYRQKAKLRRDKNSESNNINANGQESRIIVRNLSFKVTENDVRKLYEPFGEIKEINLLTRPDGNLVGCGFIHFKRVEDASKAIFNTNKKEFLGRTISSDWAISRSKFCEKFDKSLAATQEIDKGESHNSQDDHDDQGDEENNEGNNTYQKKMVTEKDTLKKQKRKKLQKMKKQKKRARIVIRNLSFQITEDKLKEHFSQYGEIEDINILSKPDGKLTGVAFLQFNIVQSAAKAIHYANMQPLLGRPIIVDWAVPKNKFSQNSTDMKPEIKTEFTDEHETHDTSEVKGSHNKENEVSDLDAEPDSKDVTIESIKVKDESDEEEAEIEDEVKNTDNENGNDNDYDSSDKDDDDDVLIDQPMKEEEENEEQNPDAKRPRRVSNDVSEGKTVFLKNVPFSVKNDELKRCMEQFGPVQYALVCIDSLTEHSKGTAFVKFRHVEDAEKCLSAGTEFRLRDQVIDAHKALHRSQVENKKSLKEQRVKDTRNLYLVKEGVVLAGSPAAVDVSVSDMQKRLKLEQWKSQMLRNLNMFISRVRLVVHNLPPNLDDEKLRQLFRNHSSPKAIIKEARVMRDLKNVDATGKGKSKEYGFVTFTSHEDALKALRSMNNNPNIFSKHKRPIIGFSIENRIMVNAKERRIQKSREQNPLWSRNKNKRKSDDVKETVPVKRVKVRKSNDSNEQPYTGITGKLGQDKLRSNFNLKSQAKLHAQAMKKQKKLNKTNKELEIMRKEKMKNRKDNMPIKRMKEFDTDETNFNKIVNNYRNKLKGLDLKKSKWYDSSNGS